jgi:hypothetical protein
VKLIAEVGALDTELAASSAVAPEERRVDRKIRGRDEAGFVHAFRHRCGDQRRANVEEVATSNRSVIVPAGPVRVAFLTRKVGRAVVVAPASGAIGTGASIVIAGPMVNFLAAVNGPSVPPAWARACQ